VKEEKIKEVDLHIEFLRDDHQSLNSDDILNIQLSEFNSCLEDAVISGLEEITFIHGIGNGILRNKIHKTLSQYPHIKYFEDARKEKFGFGATKVHLK
jgi:dsDNA-specific endonuclease/ATPase MutS2